MIKKDEYGKLSNHIYFAQTIYISRDSDKKNNYSIVLLNTEDDTYVQLQDINELHGLTPDGFADLNWKGTFENPLLSVLGDYLNRNIISYYSVDAFGFKVDIAPFITSGQYVPLESDSQFVYSLTNKMPYAITSNDISELKGSLKEWESTEDKYDFESNNITINDISYSHSRLFQTITDVYTVDVESQLNNIDTILNFEFTFTNLLNPSDSSGKKVVLIEND